MRELLAWTRTRLLQWRIALLWLLVLAAALAAGPSNSIGWTLLFTAALIVQFRLWDDLEDLPHDRVHAPQRVLARCTRFVAFRLALATSIGLIASAFALLQGWGRVVAYLLLLAALAALYRTMDGNGPQRALRAQFVLLKYPALLLLLTQDPTTPRALVAASALYAMLAVHEWRDQRSVLPP